MSNRIMQMVLLGIKEFRDPYYQGFAAQVAFFLMLSIVPVVIVLSRVLSFFSISMRSVAGWIENYVPEQFADTLTGLITYTPNTAMNILFVVIAVWSGSRAQFAMMRIANYILSEGKSTGQGYFRDRFRAFRTMFLTLFSFAFALIILVYGEFLFKLIATAITQDFYVKYEIASFWRIIRWPVALLLYFLAVSYNYYVMPTEKIRYKEVMPGSVFAAVGMFVVTLIYTYYVDYIASYDIIYGSLASIVALLFWFYFLAWALGLGVLCNKVWADTKK